MYSEEELGNVFQKYIKKSRKTDLPKYDLLFKEVQSIQGIPDYVGLYFNTPSKIELIRKVLKSDVNSISNISKLLPYIKKNAPHNIEYLSKKTNIPSHIVNSVLTNLKEENIVQETEKLKYILSIDFDISDLEIWSFELKLKNWKRAVFQALRYKTFSDYVYIVMPVKMKEILIKNEEKFRDFNIGVIIYDEKLNEFNRIIRAKKNVNKSKSHTYYVLLQILNKIKNGDRLKIN